MLAFKASPAFSSALPRLSRRPSRSLALISFVFVSFLLFIFWRPKSAPRSPYYNWQTKTIFPPSAPVRGDAELQDFCSNFPSHLLDRIQVVVRAGAGDHDRLDAQLATVSSCIHNLIIFSDLNEKHGEHQLIDVLEDLPQSYFANNPDFDIYKKQKEAQQRGEKIEYSKEGYRLDKYKFLPMLEKVHEMRPRVDWYVFLETDSYIFWDTLFRLLNQYSPSDPHFIGAPVPGSKAGHFPYGGAGFVTSQGFMKKYLSRGMFGGVKPSEKYEKWAREECCGDIIMANVVQDRTGIVMERLWPTFNGEELVKVQVDRRTWCVPLVAMHRLTAEQMASTWKWERTRFDDGKPVLHSTLIYHRQSQLPNESIRESWDNLSEVDSPNGLGHTSSVACRVACESDPNCFQYSYTTRRCRFAWGVRFGNPVKDKKERFISGWDVKKIKAMGFDFNEEGVTGCEKEMWELPESH